VDKRHFAPCPKCNGYGVLDNGKYCKMCGGTDKTIGSGEIIVDENGRHISLSQLIKEAKRAALREINPGDRRRGVRICQRINSWWA